MANTWVYRRPYFRRAGGTIAGKLQGQLPGIPTVPAADTVYAAFRGIVVSSGAVAGTVAFSGLERGIVVHSGAEAGKVTT